MRIYYNAITLQATALKQDLRPHWTRFTSSSKYTNCFSCCFLSVIPKRSGVFTPLVCFFRCPPDGRDPVNQPAPFPLFPSWWHQHCTLLGYLLLFYSSYSWALPYQEDHDTFWQYTLRCWNEAGLITGMIYLTAVSCKHAEHSKA